MKTTLRATLILALFAVSSVAFAGAKSASASFSATFVVNESCAVQANTAKPTVSCQFNTPYQVASSTAKVAAAPSNVQVAQAADVQLVTITF